MRRQECSSERLSSGPKVRQKATLDPFDITCDGRIVLSLRIDLSDGMHHCRVISSTEVASGLLRAVSGVPTPATCRPAEEGSTCVASWKVDPST